MTAADVPLGVDPDALPLCLAPIGKDGCFGRCGRYKDHANIGEGCSTMSSTSGLDIPTMLRPMEDRDLAFVWETTLKVRKPYSTPWNDWLLLEGIKLRHELARDGSYTRVLESGDVIVGFATFYVGFSSAVSDVLHMIYVKRDLRGFGFGLSLVGTASPPLRVSRPNACWRKWALAKNLRWREAT